MAAREGEIREVRKRRTPDQIGHMGRRANCSVLAIRRGDFGGFRVATDIVD